MLKFENELSKEAEFQSLAVDSSKEDVSELVDIPGQVRLGQEYQTVSENRKQILISQLQRHKRRHGIFWSVFCLIYMTLMVSMPMIRNFEFLKVVIGFILMAAAVTFAVISASQKDKIKRGLIAITKKVSVQESSNLISSLVNLLSPEDVKSSVNREVMELLTKHLPEMKASDAHLLTQAQKDRLTRELKLSTSDRSKSDLLEVLFPNETRIRYRIAILKAFEQIGGVKELAEVKRLATEKPMNRKAIQVQDAARECLPYLQARAEGEQAKSQLLRASTMPTNDAELLRPHVGNADLRHTKELLRPS